MILRTFLAAVAMFLAAAPAVAQLPVVKGEPALTPKTLPVGQVRLPAGTPIVRASLAPVTEAEVASVRAANGRDATKASARRLVIGVVRSAESTPPVIASAATLRWAPVAGGHAAQVAVTSPEAGSMRLSVDLAGAPPELEMIFFGSDTPSRIEGPIRVSDVADRTAPWWSPITEGDTQTVEFFVPARYDPAKLALRVMRASHLFTTPSSRFSKRLADIGSSGSCEVDLACSSLNNDAAFRNAAASVAQMVFNDAGFLVLCSGSLLADSDPASQVPYFYSANHCFDNESQPFKTPAQMQQVANTLSTLWDFQAATCGSHSPSTTWQQLNGGATYIYSNPQSDVLLVRLNNPPPAGAFYSGWDANPLDRNTTVYSIHHPQGDLKKVSRGSVVGFGAPGVAGAFNSFIEVLWNSGTTEPGSSGGGLWSTTSGQYYLRGGLWGGTALCTNPNGTDNFSRFDQAYSQLSQYLGAVVTPAYDFTDLWWNPNESGWGLNLTQHPSRIIFGVWYTYEADGTRIWYTMSTGSWTDSMTYTGPLYVTSGPSYNKAFDPNQVQVRQVGTGTLRFSGPNTGTFTYSVDGVQGTKSIQRQPF
jgi:hypothetical protein